MTLDLRRDLHEWRDRYAGSDDLASLASILHAHARRMVFFGPNIVIGPAFDGVDVMIPALDLTRVERSGKSAVASFEIATRGALSRRFLVAVSNAHSRAQGVQVFFGQRTYANDTLVSCAPSQRIAIGTGALHRTTARIQQAMQSWIDGTVNDPDPAGRPVRLRRDFV